MKRKVTALIFGLLLCGFGIGTVRAQILVIDNFNSFKATRTELVNNSKIIARNGNSTDIVGGRREISFSAAPIPGGATRSTLLEIPREGPMFVESGVNSSTAVQLFYGTGNPLNLALRNSGYNKFQIEFGASDLALNYFIQVFDRNANSALLSGVGIQSTANQNLPFTVTFPFDDFVSSPNPVNWNEIDSIVVSFATGNATGGQDFVVNRIVAVP